MATSLLTKRNEGQQDLYKDYQKAIDKIKNEEPT